MKYKFIEELEKKYKYNIEICYDEPMSEHTTFKVGGNADVFIRPLGDEFPAFCAELLDNAQKEKVPVYILGGGANIVVSDNGIRGIVLDTSGWKGVSLESDDTIVIKSGATMDEAAEAASELSLSGLEFLAGMPGTIGGAVYMNARCYGSEIADVLAWTEIYKIKDQRITRINANKSDFNYKISPFQKMDCLILNAAFKLKQGDKEKIKNEMLQNRQDRETKGHYRFPCAGSAFKNNRDFGKPTGQIIDELGLCGFQIGGAQIAPFHGNIVINTGNAAACDIRALMNEVASRVKNATGFALEPEILFVGE